VVLNQLADFDRFLLTARSEHPTAAPGPPGRSASADHALSHVQAANL